MKLLIGKIKNDCSEDLQELRGIKLVGFTIDEEDKKLHGIHPINLGDMEKFYKFSFEGLKNDISEDYDYCIWYLLGEDCEFVSSINLNELEDIREFTKEDDELYGKNLEEFKKIHHFYDMEQRIKDEEKAENKANEEFLKEKKQKIEVRVRGETETIDAVIYRGFGIHNPLDIEDSSFKTITILEGDNKGLAMIHYCKTSKCKTLINEMRESIGDKAVANEDRVKLAEIVKKY
ncbi:hypothetical protein [Clostridium sp. BJN0013]|uniref:hypothetical protein n=1 Tax=Clostridium sp. BJN0013 TaxID=3236840 RepID=UPI0034C675E2